MNRTLALIAVAALLAACGGSEFDDGSGDEADATGTFNYKCPNMHRYVAGTDVPATFFLHLTSTKGRMGDTASGAASAQALPFDKTWKDSSGGRDFVRYKGDMNGIGHELRVEPALKTGGYALHNGSKGGYAKIEARSGEGYDSWSGICFRQ